MPFVKIDRDFICSRFCGISMGKRTKKERVSASGASLASPSPYSVGDDDSRLRFRQMFLGHDYDELWMETEAKKKRLMKLIKRKLQLLAEIKFLEKKLKSLTENPPQARQFNLHKQQPDKSLSPLSVILEEPINSREYGVLDRIQCDDDDEVGDAPCGTIGSSVSFDWSSENEKGNIWIKEDKPLKDAKNVGANRVTWTNPVVSMVHHFRF